MILTNLSTRMTTPDPAPATVTFSALLPCGCVGLWTQVYGGDSLPMACTKDPCATGVRGRIAGTGTEEPRRSDDSPASESATGLPTPRPLKTTGGATKHATH